MGRWHWIELGPLPGWIPVERLLGDHDWTLTDEDPGWRRAKAQLDAKAAADIAARLRGLGFGGRPLEIVVRPSLRRSVAREALRQEARRRRSTTRGFTRAGALMDSIGKMSLTPEPLALAMAEAAGASSVIDAGCGVGGNAIAFARRGAQVVAIERDADRLEMARHNAELYGVQDRIELVHGDWAEVLPERSAELLFLDPPWGSSWNKRRTELADLVGLDLALRSGGHFERIWIKLPPSFDHESLPELGTAESPVPYFGDAEGDRARIKLVLARIDCRRA